MAVLVCFALAGCRASETPVTRDAVIGSYVYNSQDPEGRPTEHEWDHLTIRADGTYNLVEGGPTKPKAERAGEWALSLSRANGQSVLPDHAGFPIQVDGSEVRLLIDDDVGIWYAKVK